jgi:hypothetical protein
MAQVATINFVDQDSKKPGVAMVRVQGDVVGLTLSLEADGDIEVFLGLGEVDELTRALERARTLADASLS